MSCENPKYIIVPNPGSGGTGPAGPTGPQGPPGSVDLPLPASDVSVTNVGYNTAQEVFDALLYVLLTIDSFSPATSVYEIGTTIGQLAFTWSYNKDILTQELTGPNDPIVLGTTERNATVDFTPNLGTTSTFTLEAYDGDNTIQRNSTVSFINGIYYGDAPLGTIDSNFVKSLSRVLQNGRNYSFASNAGVGEHAWFAHKTSLGTATFTAGGFAGGFEPPVTISFLNASGYTEDYYVYRSTNTNIGPVNIIVS